MSFNVYYLNKEFKQGFMSNYSIRDLEKLSGIRAHTIRIWEKRYNLISPDRTETNIRLYSDDDLKKILNISILNRNGLKISKIACLETQEISDQVNAISRKTWSFESQIEKFMIAMIDFDEEKFEKLLSELFIQLGFEDTMLKVIYPFLNRIGIMWQTGSINPAQEHFVSNLIRQKMIVAIDGIMPVEKVKSSRFLLFLPEGEFHELALLFYYYLIKKRGHDIIYLGQSAPFSDVREVCKKFNFQYLLTYYTSSVKYKELTAQLTSLVDEIKDVELWVGGVQLQQLEIEQLPQIKRAVSPEIFLKMLNSI